MQPLLPYAALCAVAYLLGAVPFALWMGRLRGVDIRRVGSGNIGATNVFRSVSKTLGVLTFLCDALKGFVPAFFFPLLLQRLGGVTTDYSGLIFGLAAVAGHNWPIYLRFKGGKGIATSAGMLLGVAPGAIAVGIIAWALAFAVTRYVSVASIAASAATPAAAWVLYLAAGWIKPAALTVLGLVLIWRHKTNIQRLCQGTEHKFGRKDG